MLPYSVPVLLIAALLALALLVIIGYMGLKLADGHGTDVWVVWYLFSLASTSTFLIAAWASSVGAVDTRGSFHGDLGSAIGALLNFMLDLEAEIKLFASLLVIVVVPLLASYLLSGLFGCASRLILVGRSVSFFVWGVVKSLVVAAGIVFALALFGYVHGWVGWSAAGAAGAAGAASMAFLPVMLLALSFYILFVYRAITVSTSTADTKRGKWLRVKVNCAKAWLTRKIKSSDLDAV